MIAKINNGNSFKGVLNYVLGEGKGYEILTAFGVLENSNVSVLTKQFVAQANLSDRVEKPVWHAQISFAKEDESLINDEKIKEIGEGYLKKMGIIDNQYLIVKHTDTAHSHIHLVINRVTSEGKVLEDNMMKKRSMEAAQKLEQEYDLTVARLKGKGYSAKDSNKEYVYGFKPNRQLLTNRIRAVFNEAAIKEFSTFKEMDSYLLSNGIKVYENITDRNGKRVSYTSLDYTYKYYDNINNREAVATNTLKTSRIANGYNMHFFRSQLALNNQKRQDKINRLVSKIEKVFEGKSVGFTNKKYLFNLLFFNDIDIRLSYFKESLQKTGLPKKLKHSIIEMYDEKASHTVSCAALKVKLFDGNLSDISFSKKMTFSFSKMDKEILGQGRIEEFYKNYIEGLGLEVPSVIKNVLGNKRADSNTTNYIIFGLTGARLPFSPNAVDANLATLCFNLAQKGQLAKTGIHKKITDSRVVLSAYRVFKEFSNSPEELLKFFAKRSIGAKVKNGNVHLSIDGNDLGMAKSLGIKELAKVTSKPSLVTSGVLLSEKYFKKAFEDNYNPERVRFYHFLDKKDINGMSLTMKEGKGFKMDDFDLKFINEDFREVLKKKFENDSHRGKISKNKRR